MMLHFGDPAKLKTKRVVFEEIFIAHDSGTLEQLKELSSRRRAVEESINESSFLTEVIAREMAGGLTSRYEQDLQKLEQYLPLLQNLMIHVQSLSNNRIIVHWTSGLKIRWTSALSTSSIFNLMGSKFYNIDSLHLELGMNLFLYGAILRERALEVLTEDLVQSATLYRKAAGVYHYLVNEVLRSLQPQFSQERPPECMSSVCSIMSLICLAEAQAVTTRKAEEKGTTQGLLAKLHYGITELLDEASSIIHSVKKDCKDISARLVGFISSCRALHELRSQKHLAEDLKGAGQLGVAIGVLRHGLAKAKMPGEESWCLVFRQEMDAICEMLRKFEHENEFVWRNKIATGDELPFLQGTRIVTVIPYCIQRWERELVFRI
ncbi:uncharacterized protein LOC122664739 [Telopea speciosissima]|uniref:uncharacterized protein LOC122664739 n=1 Tax=Telopea speciosissima TaxID=54955 RepID=UPI001CC4A938|nr:uncharacterized protein LOC122664739 [Telopea speciosissima]